MRLISKSWSKIGRKLKRGQPRIRPKGWLVLPVSCSVKEAPSSNCIVLENNELIEKLLEL